MRLVNDETRYRLDVQRSSIDQVATKASFVAGVAVTLLTFLAAANGETLWKWLALLAFALTAACSLNALRLRKWREVPEPRPTADHAWQHSEEEVLVELLNSRISAFAINETRRAMVHRWWWLSVASLAAGTTLGLAHLVTNEETEATVPEMGDNDDEGKQGSTGGLPKGTVDLSGEDTRSVREAERFEKAEREREPERRRSED
ncbi:MAG: hypothetical protein JJE52_03975 [Acidimicrobiia bacterium]|nr:hypothetical protein [Acidimicrobiia bacterium]